jgi:transcriptional regulator GlxA family with amidase domain
MLPVGFLVFPEFNILDLSGPLAVFDVPRRTRRPVPYALKVLSERGGPVTSSCGLTVDTRPAARARLDTLVIVGGSGVMAAMDSRPLIEFIRRTARRARRVSSVCTGAFLLAEAQLLDGRRATTHWQDAGRLKRMYPRVRVESDQIFVSDGRIWTSGGVTAGIDLALALVEEDLGLEMAQATARELVVYHRRAGGQSQFSTLLELEPPSDRIRRALQFAREHLHEGLPVERLAAAVQIGPRQFSRVFLRETGETPAKAVERLRAEVAQVRVAGTAESIEVIAQQVGFLGSERMRRAFIRLFGQPPQALRRIARQARRSTDPEA